MHGLFIARGGAFRSGVTVPAFSNLHVYELICRVLEIVPAPNEGDVHATEAILKPSSEELPQRFFRRSDLLDEARPR